MALPTEIESDIGSESGDPVVVTHAATPSNGQLLLAFLQNESSSNSVITPASGFTLLDSQTSAPGTQPSIYIYFRVASGEASAAYTWEATNGRLSVQQYRFSGAGTPVSKGKNTSTSSAVTSLNIAGGSQSIDADNICIAHLAMENGEAVSWTDSFVEETNWRAEMRLAKRSYSSGGTAQPVPTWTGAQVARGILIAVPGAGGGGGSIIPKIMHHRRMMQAA